MPGLFDEAAAVLLKQLARQAASPSSAARSGCVRLTFALCWFSSKCAIDAVPGIGAITGDLWRSQASKTWCPVA
jgi:hypothetical protein